MMTKVDASKPVQANLFKVMLRDLVFERHELVLLKKAIDWKRFEKVLEPAYCENNGRPSIPVRTMVGLTFLKYMFGLSDQEVLDNWVENPYWQYFCGGEFFEHEPPTDQTVMSRWRKRAGESGVTADRLNAMLAAVGFNLVKLMRGLKRLFLCLRTEADGFAAFLVEFLRLIAGGMLPEPVVLRYPSKVANQGFA